MIIISIMLGIGLAMDACAVSMANGLKEPKMKLNKIFLISILFGLFQGLMPLLGYMIGSSFLTKIEWIIPWIALILLTFIGIKMIIEAKKHDNETKNKDLTLQILLVQTIATSIDALSVGFTIANYSIIDAIICVCIIAIITFILSFLSVLIGKKFGDKLGSYAEVLGGIILIIIGLEIFIKGII